jgi:hypothetical protein
VDGCVHIMYLQHPAPVTEEQKWSAYPGAEDASFLSHCYAENAYFAKTGSGQTQAKLRKRATTFCRLLRSEQGPRGEKTALFGHFLY